MPSPRPPQPASLPALPPPHYSRPGRLAPDAACAINDLAPFARMASLGVNLVQVYATPTADIYDPGTPVWLGPDTFDYATQEAGWHRLLALNPDLQLCLRISVGSPQWWDDAHPGELQRGADGSPHFNLQHGPRRTIPSVASERWRADCGLALRRFLDWLKTSGWSARVWGYMVCAGITYEWGLLGGDTFPDTSAPMLRRFRAYLREHYATDSALRAAWADTTVTLDTAAVPSRAARENADGDFRQFPRDRPAFDFQRCLSVANAESLLDTCRLLREHGEPHQRIGTFYGYTLTTREGDSWSVRFGACGFAGGHHALAPVLRSGLVDFIASPYAYGNRDLGLGTLVPHFPWSSVRHHGVASCLENDLWSFTNLRTKEGGKLSVGQTLTREDSLLHQRLAFATALCRGESLWWFDLTNSKSAGRELSNYSDPAVHAELARQFAAWKTLAARRGADAAQIALVIDESAKDALALSSKLFLHEIYHALESWSWCGAPFDVWLASDVTPETMARYRLVYLFAPALPAVEQTRLHAALIAPDRTLWLAPGTDLADAPRALRHPCAGLTPQDLALIAARAGVHRYADAPAQVWASENLVSVHVRGAGPRRLAFPGNGPWREHFSETSVTDTFTFSHHDVRLFERPLHRAKTHSLSPQKITKNA